MKLTAAKFQEKYGDVVSQHFAQYTTARTLRAALAARKPPITVTDGMLKVWYHGFHSASRPPPHFLNFWSGLVLGLLAAASVTGGGLAELFSPPRISANGVYVQNTVSQSNTKMVLLSKHCFWV